MDNASDGVVSCMGSGNENGNHASYKGLFALVGVKQNAYGLSDCDLGLAVACGALAVHSPWKYSASSMLWDRTVLWRSLRLHQRTRFHYYMHAWGSVALAVDRVVPEEIVDKGRAGVHASVLEFPSGGVVFLVSISAESTCFRAGYVAAPYIAIADNADGFLS